MGKKIALIILFALFILSFVLLLVNESFGGGVFLLFPVPSGNQKVEAFAREFVLEMQKKKRAIVAFNKDYSVTGYLGLWRHKVTGETKSTIGLFIDEEGEPAETIWLDDLFSLEAIKESAKKSAERIFERLKEKDNETKNKNGAPIQKML